MKKILSFAAFACFAMAGMAQSSKADLKMMEGKFAEALPIVEAAIAENGTKMADAKAKAEAKGKPFDPSKFNAQYAGLYNQLGKCQAQIFNPELLKAANQQPLDTALFASALDKMVDGFSKSYIYDHTPDAKGKVKAKYDADNVRTLEGCLDYYFYAAIFNNQNGDLKKAGEYFKKHVDFPSIPALAAKKDSILAAKKDNYETASYYGAIINYQLKDYKGVLDIVDSALKTDNEEYKHDLYLMKAEAVLQTTQDTVQYCNVMKDAVLNMKDNQSFADGLVSIYYQQKNAPAALESLNSMLATNPNSDNLWYIKGVVQMNLQEDFAGARESFEKALALNPDNLKANSNMGIAFINEGASMREAGKFKLLDLASVTSKQKAAYDKELAEFKSFYEKALPYLEKAQSIAPDQPKVWAPALQRVYYNLDQKAKADEMDDILRAAASSAQ